MAPKEPRKKILLFTLQEKVPLPPPHTRPPSLTPVFGIAARFEFEAKIWSIIGYRPYQCCMREAWFDVLTTRPRPPPPGLALRRDSSWKRTLVCDRRYAHSNCLKLPYRKFGRSLPTIRHNIVCDQTMAAGRWWHRRRRRLRRRRLRRRRQL